MTHLDRRDFLLQSGGSIASIALRPDLETTGPRRLPEPKAIGVVGIGRFKTEIGGRREFRNRLGCEVHGWLDHGGGRTVGRRAEGACRTGFSQWPDAAAEVRLGSFQLQRNLSRPAEKASGRIFMR